MIRIHTLLPAMLLIAGSGLSSDVFDMDADWTSPVSGQHSNLLFVCDLLNDDSIPDLIMGNFCGDYIRVYYGEGDGSFIPGEQYSIANPGWIETADIDNDGDIDAIVRCTPVGPDSFSVCLNDGSGIFSEIVCVNDPGFAEIGSFSILDFDCDGFPDIIAATGFDEVCFFQGNGDGSFSPQVIHYEPLDPFALTCSDVDCDGDTDIILVCWERMSLLLNNGDGTVTWSGYFGYFSNEACVASLDLGDLNGDGYEDIVSAPGATLGEFSIHTFLGDGTGNFNQSGLGWISLGVAFTQTDVNDYDLDGNNDAFFTGSCGNMLMLGDGSGELPLIDYFNYSYSYCWQAAVADLDLDGDIDYVTAHKDYPIPFRIEVFLNKTIQLGIEENEQSFIDLIPILSVTSNPVSESTGVWLSLSEPSFCILNVYDVHGRMVSQVFNGDLAEGNHQLIWNSSALPAGCYTLVLDTQSGQSCVRCVKID